jgi:hypothetical protein
LLARDCVTTTTVVSGQGNFECIEVIDFGDHTGEDAFDLSVFAGMGELTDMFYDEVSAVDDGELIIQLVGAVDMSFASWPEDLHQTSGQGWPLQKIDWTHSSS